MDFGAFFKLKRIEKGLTLRQFCEDNDFDPGNISKLERGILAAPQSDDKLKKYAKALGIKPGGAEYIEFIDLAATSGRNFKVKNIKDPDLLKMLPVLFRTLDKKDLTEDKLERIIKIIKEEANG